MWNLQCTPKQQRILQTFCMASFRYLSLPCAPSSCQFSWITTLFNNFACPLHTIGVLVEMKEEKKITPNRQIISIDWEFWFSLCKTAEDGFSAQVTKFSKTNGNLT